MILGFTIITYQYQLKYLVVYSSFLLLSFLRKYIMTNNNQPE